MKLVYYSVTSNEVPNLSEAARIFKDTIGPLEIYARTRTQLEERPEAQEAFVRQAVKADAVVVTLMGGAKSCPVWDNLSQRINTLREQGAQAPYFHIQPTGSNAESLEMVGKYSDGFEDGTWTTISRYYRYGGVDNLKNLLVFLYNRTRNKHLAIDPPMQPPYEGLYHPDAGYIPDPDAYINKLVPEKPTMGIWFYQNFFTSNNKAHIDAMIREAESQGANVICVFHMRMKDELLGNQGPDYVVNRFFMKNGHPLIDVLISPVMFSLQTTAPEYKDLLSRLGCRYSRRFPPAEVWPIGKPANRGWPMLTLPSGWPNPNWTG